MKQVSIVLCGLVVLCMCCTRKPISDAVGEGSVSETDSVYFSQISSLTLSEADASLRVEIGGQSYATSLHELSHILSGRTDIFMLELDSLAPLGYYGRLRYFIMKMENESIDTFVNFSFVRRSARVLFVADGAGGTRLYEHDIGEAPPVTISTSRPFYAVTTQDMSIRVTCGGATHAYDLSTLIPDGTWALVANHTMVNKAPFVLRWQCTVDTLREVTCGCEWARLRVWADASQPCHEGRPMALLYGVNYDPQATSLTLTPFHLVSPGEDGCLQPGLLNPDVDVTKPMVLKLSS